MRQIFIRGKTENHAGLGRALAALCILCLTLPNLIWLMRDHTVWPWDQAWYGEVTLDLFQAEKAGPIGWGKAMLGAIGAKPPLLTWLGQAFVPLAGPLGRVEPALLLLNVLCAMTTLALVYATGRRIGASRAASLAGTVICGGASLFIGMTNQFFVEPLQMACATLLLFIAASFDKMSAARLCTLFILAATASFLTKASSFTFVLPILAYLAVVFLISKSWSAIHQHISLLDAGLIASALASTAAAIAWYATNWTAMTQHFTDATNSNVALLYGSIGSFPTKAVFWIGSLARALSPSPWLLILIAGATLVAIATATCRTVVHARSSEWPGRAKESGLLFGGLVAGLILVNLYGLSKLIIEETRFLAPLVPCLGVLTAWALAVIGKRTVTLLLGLAGCANALVGIAYTMTTNPLGIVPSTWLKPYQVDDSAERRLDLAVALSCGRPGGTEIIGVEYPSFNANSAAFYSAKQRLKRGYRCYYTSLGYAETDVTKALGKVALLDPDYFVTVDPLRQIAANAFNRVSLPVAQALRHDPRFRQVPTADPTLLVLSRDRSFN